MTLQILIVLKVFQMKKMMKNAKKLLMSKMVAEERDAYQA